MNAMEKALYSALYDVMANVWHQVEAEQQPQAANENDSELREAA